MNIQRNGLRNKLLIVVLLVISSFSLAGCNGPIEFVARDSIAVAKGIIQSAQVHYKSHCAVDPGDRHCVLINQGVDVQNLAVDALVLYCGSHDFLENAGPCEPNKELEPRLKEALGNMRPIIRRINDLIKGAD